MSGFVAYKGPSLIDKKPIVGIVTLESNNTKTGNVATLWILREDIEPHQAIKTGEDRSICGNCKHRHYSNGSCYVLVHNAPLSIYRAYKRGKYPMVSKELLTALSKTELRLGGYGEPAAIPDEILQLLTSVAQSHLGYSHSWKNKRLSHAMKYCQGSVDSIEEAREFQAMYPEGKYFRVTSDKQDMLEGEIECLADSKGLTCKQCGLCDGTKQNIVIEVHGSKASRFESTIDIREVS